MTQGTGNREQGNKNIRKKMKKGFNFYILSHLDFFIVGINHKLRCNYLFGIWYKTSPFKGKKAVEGWRGDLAISMRPREEIIFPDIQFRNGFNQR
ncbi:MAG: hypothetical protein F6K01_11965 [Okeania sp. SIO1I7]|nr:hypothetical protein [Okeania sp. SIO1I7]